MALNTLIVSGFEGHKLSLQDLMQSFREDGPITKASIVKNVALVTFEDAESATKAQQRMHTFEGIDGKKELFLKFLDNECSPEEMLEMDDEQMIYWDQSILKLNDDCILAIFSYLNLRDLIIMEEVCERFKTAAMITYRSYNVLDFDALTPYPISHIPLQDAIKISQAVGPYVHTLIVTEHSFAVNTDTDRLLLEFSKSCKNLENIELGYFRDTSTKVILEALGKVMKTMKVAKFIDWDNYYALKKILRDAQFLEKLDVTGSVKTWEFLENVHGIKEIVLECYEDYPGMAEHFIKFCKGNPQLRSLKIDSYFLAWYPNCLQDIVTNLENLVTFETDSYYSCVNYGILANLPKLTHLELENIEMKPNESSEFLLKIASVNRLEYLDISFVLMNEDILRALGHFSNLKVLKMNSPDDNTFTNLTLLPIILNMKRLEELHLQRNYIITLREVFGVIVSCPTLRLVDVSGNSDMAKDLLWIIPQLNEQPQRPQMKLFITKPRNNDLYKHLKTILNISWIKFNFQ